MHPDVFHPRYYPYSLGLCVASLAGLLFFHFYLRTPLQDRLDMAEDRWRTGRSSVSELIRYEKALQELQEFSRSLPQSKHFPSIVSTLSDLARRHRLTIPSINYQREKATASDLTRVSISFGVEGSYRNIRSFIRSVEASDQFMIIEDLNLLKPGKDHQAPIQMQLRMAIYLRPTPTRISGEGP